MIRTINWTILLSRRPLSRRLITLLILLLILHKLDLLVLQLNQNRFADYLQMIHIYTLLVTQILMRRIHKWFALKLLLPFLLFFIKRKCRCFRLFDILLTTLVTLRGLSCPVLIENIHFLLDLLKLVLFLRLFLFTLKLVIFVQLWLLKLFFNFFLVDIQFFFYVFIKKFRAFWNLAATFLKGTGRDVV